VTIIIPSRNSANVEQCIAALQRCEPEAQLLVIDDGLEFRPDGAEYVAGEKPFVFARNVNLGICLALARGEQWIGVWNDDALLKTPRGLTQMIDEWPRNCGIAAPACTNVGNLNQHPHGSGGWRSEPRMLCFTAVVFPRELVDRIGLLDERFTGYGWEDNDYCRRAREAGFALYVYDRCIVDHSSLQPTFRTHARAGGDIWGNAEIYRQKWGDLQ
jgi:glycosyltransferase involved in cell wall biosynthesis